MDASTAETQVPVIAVTAAVGAVVLLLVLLCSIRKQTQNKKEANGESHENGISKDKRKKQQQKKTKAGGKSNTYKSKSSYSHPWLAGTLKGHGSNILDVDFSSNNKYLISCADDRSIFLWSVKDFTHKEHKFHRINVELDHATKVRFSPDSKAYIVALYVANTIRVYKIGKKDDGSPGNIVAAGDFPQKHNQSELLEIGISSNGKFIMTAFCDTTIILWDLKGDVIANIDTHQISNSCCAVSPCGRFIGSAGFTTDVKVWHVVFDKKGIFKEVARAFELKGHRAGIYHFSFSNDSSRMASISKDKTWKLWNTNIEYQLDQDPYLLFSVDITLRDPSVLSLAPDGRSVAIASGTTLYVYETLSGELAETFTDVHSEPIRKLAFDQGSKYLISTGDRHICIFHNIPGYKGKVDDLQNQRNNARNQSIRDRLTPQLQEAKTALENILDLIQQK